MNWKDKYRIVAVLKERSGTKVCLVEHIQLKQLRIMKTISGALGHTSAAFREAVLMRELKHPCIPVIYDIEEQEDGITVIEEYLKGESLSSYFQNNHPGKEKITEILCQLLDVLEYLHCQEPPLLHLDLKPDNLLIHEGSVYLIDFGSAQRGQQIAQGTLTGTPGFAAPECYQGSAGTRSDIYSAGKLLEYMLTQEKCITRRDQKLQQHLLRIAKKAARQRPEERYATAEQMRQAMLRKTRNLASVKPCCVLAVAGTGRRMGVTWTSFQFAAFVKKLGKKAVYLECNESGVLAQLFRKNGRRSGENLFCYRGIPVLEAAVSMYYDGSPSDAFCEEEDYLKELGFQIIVKDFGVLTPEKKAAFLRADMSILLTGANDWELENTWRCFKLLHRETKRLCVLLNFAQKRSGAALAKKLKNLPCFSLPFVAGEETGQEAKRAGERTQEIFAALYERLQTMSVEDAKKGDNHS